MANHVNSNVVIDTDEAGMAKYKELVLDKLEKEEGHEKSLHVVFSEDYDYNLMCEKVGAKWAYASDLYDNVMNITSAWSPVVEFCEWLSVEIGKVDPDATISHTWEDEMPNFVGVAYYDANGKVDWEDLEWEELENILISKYPKLRDEEHWDEDEEDYTDEGREFLWEVQWEEINEWQFDALERMQ